MGIRSFIALGLAEPIVELLSSCADDIRATDRGREIRWLAPDNYHLTLEFLGDVEPGQLRALGAALGEQLHGFTLAVQRIDEVSYFPFIARPRVVAALLRHNDSLSQLHRRVSRAVRAVGLAVQRRRFQPHITIGRVRARRAPRLQIPPVSLGVTAELSTLRLYESRLLPDGAVYTPLYEADLPVAVPAGQHG